jgi:IS5 family transposase
VIAGQVWGDGRQELGFSDYELTTDEKRTKREKFLAEMETVVPWQALLNQIEPYFPKTSKKGGRPSYPLATMLWLHLLQQWYSLSDPAMEEALIEVLTMSRFGGIPRFQERCHPSRLYTRGLEDMSNASLQQVHQS